MEFIGVVKRVLPFVLTFAAGLFIASFFVTVGAPAFNFDTNRSPRSYRDCRRTRNQYRQLWDENQQMRREMEMLRMQLQLRDAEMNGTTTVQTAPVDKTPKTLSTAER